MKERKISITPKDDEGKRTVEEIARIIAAAMKRLSAVRRPVGVN